MSIYPITVRKQSGRADSVSGGKDYHLVMISCADGRCLFITRFGKKDTWGTGFHTERYATLGEANRAWETKWKEKLGRAYDEIIIDSTKNARDWAEFRKALGEPYWNKIGSGNLEWIMPGADTKGVREEKTKEFEMGVDGRYQVVEPPKRLVPDAVEAPEDRAKETPVWGMF